MAQVTAGHPSRPSAFSTTGLPEEQRIELWESHNADALIGLHCKTLTGAVLEATEINVGIDRIQLARVQGSSQVVERDAALIRQRPVDSVALFFNLAGEAFFYHDDGVRVVAQGQLLVCDADEPFIRGFSHGVAELVLKIPRAVFADTTGIHRVDRPTVVNFAAGANPFAHTLARQLGAATRADDPDAVDERAVLDLVRALAGRGQDANLGETHRAAARTYVEQHLGDASLSATRIAAAVGISSRHLSRVFAEADTSVPKFVLERRLVAARRLLDGPTLSIAEISHRVGFVSAAHFSNAFTARFGERASDVQRRATAARAVD